MDRIEHWIDGKPVAGSGGETFETVNPENGQPLARVCSGTDDDVASAVESAHRAFADYGRLGPSAREQILLRAAELLQQRSGEFCESLIDEIGSPMAKAQMEIGIATRVLRANAAMARRMTGRTYASDVAGRWSHAVRRPLGVVAATRACRDES